MALDSEAKRWSMLRVSDPGLVINPSGSNLDSEVERLTLLRVYGGLTVSDTTAPVLSSPTGTATGTTTADGTVDTDEGNGTLYFWATENASETAAAIKASGDSQAVVATGTQNVSFSGLTAETTYYAHYVHDDAASNESNVVSSAAFTTLAEEVGAGTSRGRRWKRGSKQAKRIEELLRKRAGLPPQSETPEALDTVVQEEAQHVQEIKRSGATAQQVAMATAEAARVVARAADITAKERAQERKRESDRDEEALIMLLLSD